MQNLKIYLLPFLFLFRLINRHVLKAPQKDYHLQSPNPGPLRTITKIKTMNSAFKHFIAKMKPENAKIFLSFLIASYLLLCYSEELEERAGLWSSTISNPKKKQRAGL